MKKQLGVGFIPYEPGDKVVLKESELIYVITDIKMSQYVVSKRIEFEVELSGRRWISPEEIKMRIQ